jgi:predicted MPP superfamily phosphohydrolase
VELIGLPGTTRLDYDENGLGAAAARRPGTVRIVLCHYPDLFLAARTLEPDLYLAGHSHGGQICLPGGYPVARHNSMPRRFCREVHRLGRTWYVINHGFGYTGIPLRLFCPSEVVELILAPGGISPTSPS